MMSVDTLSIAKDLKAAELPPEQAEAIAAAIGRSISEGSATKGDLLLVKQELKSDIAEVRGEIAQLRAELKGTADQLRTELKGTVDQLRAELKGTADQLRAEMERMRNQILLGVLSSQIALAGVIIAVVKL